MIKSWKKKSFKILFIKFILYFLLVILGISLLYWGLEDTSLQLDKEYYWADLNTGQCSPMPNEVGHWLNAQEKNLNPCETYELGEGKFVLSCTKGQNYVLGKSRILCLEAMVDWKKKLFL